jgi:hypothetical protein
VVTVTSPAAGLTNVRTPLLLYTVSDGATNVSVDGVAVNKVSGDQLDALDDGAHIVRITAVNGYGSDFAEVRFTVDATAPVVNVSSPPTGITNNNKPLFIFSVSDGTAVVKLDAVAMDKVSGSELDALTDGKHVLRVEAADAAGNTGFAEIAFTVDTVPPVVTLSSPVSGTTNDTTPPLVYSVSDGTVVVSVDNAVVCKTSGEMLDALDNGNHAVRVEATDTAGNSAFAEVLFTVDAASAGNDDTNIYCSGTATYIVNAGNFASGISVPSANNEIRIASPAQYATISGSKTILKGAMDTTLPVVSVSVIVTAVTGSTTSLAQVNGKYFAAQVAIASGDNTITVTATDQNGGQHQASVTVIGTGETDRVTLTASPSTGIPTLKQSGETLLDVALRTSASLTTAASSYAFDFSGSGTSELTCYSHPDVTVSYEQVGLYLTTVTVTDSAGNQYKDTAIVNVLDKEEMDNQFKAIWSGMKEALLAGDITTATADFNENSKSRYQQVFAEMIAANSVGAIYSGITEIVVSSIDDTVAEYWAIRQESDGIYAYPITFVKNSDGVWEIMGF